MDEENRNHEELHRPPAEPATVSDDAPLYTARFFQVFLAILLFMTGIALQFHFGQYVAFVGYGPKTLGWILGISVVGSLLVRLHVGGWVDRFGCRPTWLAGTLIVAVAVAATQFTQQIWLITLLRAVWALATCLVMTTVAVFAAQIAPPQRRAESIGMLGLAGLLGIMIGPTMGDWIFAGPALNADAALDIFPFRVFFTASAVFALASGVVVLQVQMPDGGGSSEMRGVPAEMSGAPAGDRFSRLRGQLGLIREHWPGSVLWVGLVFSMVFCLQSSFLERLAEERGFQDVKVFFLVYSPTAIVLRVIFRRLPQQIGRSRTLVIGLLALTVGLALLVDVGSQAQLILPGMFMGMGHCFVFPSMVDLAASRFPMEHRGTATSLILGAGDVGMIIGYASMGELVEHWGFSTTLRLLATLVLANTILFTYLRRDTILGRRRVKRSNLDPPGNAKSGTPRRHARG